MATTRKTTTRKPRATRTKAEVTSAFDEIVEGAEGAEALDPQAAVLSKEHIAKTRAAVAGLSVDTIVAKGATLGLEIGRTLSGLTEQCVQKATELKTLQDAVEIESKELERLYDIDIIKASTQLIIQEHEETKAQHEKELGEIRTAWATEQLNYTKTISERNIEQQQRQKREEEQYLYNRMQTRQKEEDTHNQKAYLVERLQAESLDAFNKDIATRRAAIESEEKQIAELKVRVAGMDEEISKAVNKAVAIATSALKKDLEFQHTMAIKDHTNALALSEQKNGELTKANGKLAEQIIGLTSALDAARTQVQDISIKALESASGQLALQKVQETVAQNGGANGNGGKRS